MRTFDNSKHRIVGFEHISTPSLTGDFWIVEIVPPPNHPNFQPMRFVVKEARWVSNEGVFYLKSDGTIQPKNQTLCVLPLLVTEV